MASTSIDFAEAVAKAASCVATPHAADDKTAQLSKKWQYVSGFAGWTTEEEKILAQAQERYKNHVRLERYILIAAALPSKSVRDVAHKISLDHVPGLTDVVRGSQMHSTRSRPMGSLAAAAAANGTVISPKVLRLMDQNTETIFSIRNNILSGNIAANTALMKNFNDNLNEISEAYVCLNFLFFSNSLTTIITQAHSAGSRLLAAERCDLAQDESDAEFSRSPFYQCS